jgi:methionyl-tRNA synthetase
MKDKLSETIKKLACIWLGHSMIMTSFFGYHYCGRCGETLGDTLAGSFPQGNYAVIIGHNCEKCKENYENMTWKDKLFVPDPFDDDSTLGVQTWFRKLFS